MSDLRNEQWDEIEQHIFQGRKIEAIKLAREYANLDLAAAKGLVDQREADLRESSPDQFVVKAKAGCTGVVILLILLTASMLA